MLRSWGAQRGIFGAVLEVVVAPLELVEPAGVVVVVTEDDLLEPQPATTSSEIALTTSRDRRAEMRNTMTVSPSGTGRSECMAA
ncbi:MAG: hypothetical protein ACOYN3_09900 [Acidimicrobiia bacterium]